MKRRADRSPRAHNGSNRDAFIREYLKDRNGTQAAIRAGYAPKSAHVTASRLLRNAKVQEALAAADAKIAAEIAETVERLAVSKERAIEQMASFAFADIRDVVEFGPDKRNIYDPETGKLIGKTSGVSIRPSEQIPAHMAACITELSEGPNGIKVKLVDKRAALMDLAKLCGWLDEKPDQATPLETAMIKMIQDIVSQRRALPIGMAARHLEEPIDVTPGPAIRPTTGS